MAAWAPAGLVPLAEAATFTAGCTLLQSMRVDPRRIETILALAASVLVLALLIALTPPDFGADGDIIDPAWLWPRPR